MGLTPVNVEAFGGLNLASDPEEVDLGGAVDILNVDLLKQGRITSRPGSVGVAQGTWTIPGMALHQDTAASLSVLLTRTDAGTRKYVGLNASGADIATQSIGGAGAPSFFSAATFGGTSGTRTYLVAGGNGGTPYRWNGATFTSVAAIPVGFFAVQQPDNRLVSVSVDGKVSFSDAGAPETFGANNYVYVTPGDGQYASGIVSWQNMVFVFKERKFFVFYGNSTDSTGNPVFNYRAVDTGVGAMYTTSPGRTMVAGRDGVYFLAWDGVYRTTGGPPVKVSGALDEWFQVGSPPFFQYPRTSPSGYYAIATDDRRLFVGVPHGGAFIYYFDSGHWSWWSGEYHAMVGAQQTVSGDPELWFQNMFGYLAYHSKSATVDLSGILDAQITSRYRSGFSDLGAAGREKTVRQTELVGQGTVSLGWSRDFGAITSTSTANVTLGTAPATTRGLHRLSQNGEQLGFQISSVLGGAWQVNRVTPMVRPFRQPGEKTA